MSCQKRCDSSPLLRCRCGPAREAMRGKAAIVRRAPRRAAAVLVSLAAVLCGSSGAADDYQPGTPFTYLFDSGKPAAEPLSPQALAAKKGWTLLPEDQTEHKFQGDAALLNDRIALVVRHKGDGAELYRLGAEGWKRRAAIGPRLKDADGIKLHGLRIAQNSRSNVSLGATFAEGDRRADTEFTLATSQVVVEVKPGEGAGQISLSSAARYVVVPDFFGDDAVIGPGALRGQALGLPAENFFLNLLQGNDAMLMCVWQSDRPGEVVAGGVAGVLTDCRVACAKGKSLWVALLEEPGLWHEREITAADKRQEIRLDWRPPFAAKWRADFTRPDGAAASWYFTGSGDEGAAAGLVRPDCPCRFDADRAIVRLGQSPVAAEGPIVVYPIDRSRATPLTAFLPIDVLRNTLGVGPCQYILQTEGLAGETNPTPDEVMNWVERELKRKKRAPAGEFRERFEQMAAYVGRAQARIDTYGAFAAQIKTLSADESLRPVVERIEAAVAAAPGKTVPAERVARLSAEVLALVEKKDPQADIARLGAEIRRVGAEQERALANCRMNVRWLWARSTGEVRARAEAVLRGK